MVQAHPFSTSDQHRTKVILMVEGSEVNDEPLAQVLSQQTSYYIFQASNAFAALRFVRSIKPNLFILNHHLPDMNGITLYDHLHAISELEDVPAIILSTCLEDCLDALERRKLIGIRKPFDLDDFLYMLEELLGWPSVTSYHV